MKKLARLAREKKEILDGCHFAPALFRLANDGCNGFRSFDPCSFAFCSNSITPNRSDLVL